MCERICGGLILWKLKVLGLIFHFKNQRFLPPETISQVGLSEKEEEEVTQNSCLVTKSPAAVVVERIDSLSSLSHLQSIHRHHHIQLIADLIRIWRRSTHSLAHVVPDVGIEDCIICNSCNFHKFDSSWPDGKIEIAFFRSNSFIISQYWIYPVLYIC